MRETEESDKKTNNFDPKLELFQNLSDSGKLIQSL